MGKSAPQAPTPPDPTVVANAQSNANENTAQFQSKLNNGNSYTPYGSVVQTQDPNTLQWSSTTTFSPQEQALFDKGTTAQSSALDVANQQIGRVGTALGQGLTPGNVQSSFGAGPQLQTGFNAGAPVQTSFNQGSPLQTGFDQGQAVQGHVNTPSQQQAIAQAEQASFGHAMNLLQPQMQQSAEHQNAQLVAQGLNPNDAAYQNSQTLFNNGQNELLNQAANNAVLTGQGEQQALYGQDLSSGQFANSAAAQQFGQNQALAQFANSAAGQQYAQNQGAAAFNNSAAGQQYAQNQGQAAFNNTAAGQQFAQNQALAGFGNQAEGQLFNQQAAAQSQPINEFAALMGQGQVQSPQGTGFNPTGVSPTDVTGAYALNMQQQNANYQAALQQQQSTLGGLFGLGSAAMSFL